MTTVCARAYGRFLCGFDVTIGGVGSCPAWRESGQAEVYQLAGGLSGGSGDVGSDDVGGVPVQRSAGT